MKKLTAAVVTIIVIALIAVYAATALGALAPEEVCGQKQVKDLDGGPAVAAYEVLCSS